MLDAVGLAIEEFFDVDTSQTGVGNLATFYGQRLLYAAFINLAIGIFDGEDKCFIGPGSDHEVEETATHRDLDRLVSAVDGNRLGWLVPKGELRVFIEIEIEIYPAIAAQRSVLHRGHRYLFDLAELGICQL